MFPNCNRLFSSMSDDQVKRYKEKFFHDEYYQYCSGKMVPFSKVHAGGQWEYGYWKCLKCGRIVEN